MTSLSEGAITTREVASVVSVKILFSALASTFLFNLSTEFDELEIRDAIENAINNYEPRALVKAIDVILTPDNNAVRVTVKFQVINSTVLQEITLTLTRLR